MTPALSWLALLAAFAVALLVTIALLACINAGRPIERRFRCSACGDYLVVQDAGHGAALAAVLAHQRAEHPALWCWAAQVEPAR